MNAITRAVQTSLANSPVSLRELGRRIGISHVQLARIASGDRNATAAVAEAVARGLEAIADESAKAASRVRRSLTKNQREAE